LERALKKVMGECRVLIVEDDDLQRSLLLEIFEEKGFSAIGAGSAEEGLKVFKEFSPHVVVTDVRLPSMDGFSFFKEVKKLDEEVEVIIITAFSNVEDAVRAIKEGAFHYITKPFSPEVLINLVTKACELVSLKKGASQDLVCESALMKEILKKARLFAKSDAPVLILGESGAGKEVLARFIHFASGRKGKFVSLNCTALPSELFEAELFGYEKGAFTGALTSKKGLIEEAEGGTLFLDEVGDMPLNLQPKLLRFLQEGEFRRLGSTKTLKASVKVVAATNKDLKKLVKEGKFREDLFYRLSILPIEVPPLRERKEDIIPLAMNFLKKYNAKYKKSVFLSQEALRVLKDYSFPGNVRELESLIHRLVLLHERKVSKDEVLELLELETTEKPFSARKFDLGKPLPQVLAEVEKELIKKALEKANFVQVKAAKLLGIDEKSLRYKRKKYGI